MDRPIAGTEDRSFDGGCHCGAIRFRATGPLREILLCHCSDCLKLSGTSWGASAAYEDHLQYLTEARPRWYRSSEGAERGFCTECGAQMFYRRDGRDVISIAPAHLIGARCCMSAARFTVIHIRCGGRWHRQIFRTSIRRIMSTKIMSTGADERRQWPIAI